MNIILEYFDVTLTIKNDFPTIKLSLKECKKIRFDVPLKCKTSSGRLVCQTGLKYYVHYLGEDIGAKVYSERKRLFSKFNLINWYINTYPADENINCLRRHYEYLKTIDSKGLTTFYSSEKSKETREKLKFAARKNASETSKRNKALWTPEFRENFIKSIDYSYENHGRKVSDFYENNRDYILKLANLPSRVSKISIAAKNMWRRFKETNDVKLKNIICSGRNKNYCVNDCKMNSIEYQVALIINSIGLDWKYEEVFSFGKKAYAPDFYIPSKKLIIEAYGDYWHANPSIFSDSKKIFKIKTAKEIWEKDALKKLTFETNGYRYLFFWESDIVSNVDAIKEKIYEYTK